MKLPKKQIIQKLLSSHRNYTRLSNKYITTKAAFIIVKTQLGCIYNNIHITEDRAIRYTKSGNHRRKGKYRTRITTPKNVRTTTKKVRKDG